MNVKVEQLEKNIKQLEIEVDVKTFNEAMQKAYIKNRKKFNVPGFRKGKVPKHVIEKYYGEVVFYEDAVNIVCPEAYIKALDDTNIEPVEQPQMDIKQIGSDKNLIFTAKVTVKPDVELGEYKGIEVKKIEYNVTEEDVENEMKKNQERNARLIDAKDKVIEKGDVAVIDYEGFIDNEPFAGGKANNHNLEIGSAQFIEGFEDQLIGKKSGEEVEVKVTFPEDYQSKDVAGKEAIFKVKINEVRIKELPELDDEFAKDVSEFETLSEYKEDVKKKMIETADQRAKYEQENAILDKVIENVKIDIPEVMIERQIDSILRNFEMRLTGSGMNLESYLKAIGQDMTKFREQFKEEAKKQVKVSLTLEKISKIEDIQVSDEDTDNEMENISKQYKMEVDKFKKTLRPQDLESIKDNLIIRKTIDMITENAKIA